MGIVYQKNGVIGKGGGKMIRIGAQTNRSRMKPLSFILYYYLWCSDFSRVTGK